MSLIYSSPQLLNCCYSSPRTALGMAKALGPPAKLLTLMRTACGFSPSYSLGITGGILCPFNSTTAAFCYPLISLDPLVLSQLK